MKFLTRPWPRVFIYIHISSATSCLFWIFPLYTTFGLRLRNNNVGEKKNQFVCCVLGSRFPQCPIIQTTTYNVWAFIYTHYFFSRAVLSDFSYRTCECVSELTVYIHTLNRKFMKSLCGLKCHINCICFINDVSFPLNVSFKFQQI